MKMNSVNFVKELIKDLLKKITKTCITLMLALCSLSAVNAVKE